STVVAAALLSITLLAFWEFDANWHTSATISICNCAFTANGGQILALCRLLPPDRKGTWHTFAVVDLLSPGQAKQRGSVLSPHISVQNVWAGYAASPVDLAAQSRFWIDGAEGLIEPSAGVIVINGSDLRAIDLKTKQVRWKRSIEPTCFAISRNKTLL